MAQILQLFSHSEAPPTTHTLESANRLIPLVLKYTEEVIERTERLSIRLQTTAHHSPLFKTLCEDYDKAIESWVNRIHRIGGVAKGLWLVDFDTGSGYLCWSYPESRIEYFHSYDTGFRNRKKIADFSARSAQKKS